MMVEIEYLSIAEFAKRAGVTTQAIYKQVKNTNSQIRPYIIKEGRKTLIKTSALQELYNVVVADATDTTQNSTISTDIPTHTAREVENVQPRNAINQPDTQPQNQPLTTDYIEYLKAQIEELKAEKADIEERMNATIQAKDCIISEQSTQLAELAQKVAQIADKALVATSQQQYLTALDKTGDKDTVVSISDYAENNEKKGFIRRLFGK